MARVRMVTRTIDVTVVKVMAVDLTTRAVESIELELTMAGAKDPEKVVKAAMPDGKVFVAVESSTTKPVLYGMPETEFIRLAQVLPARAGQDEQDD